MVDDAILQKSLTQVNPFLWVARLTDFHQPRNKLTRENKQPNMDITTHLYTERPNNSSTYILRGEKKVMRVISGEKAFRMRDIPKEWIVYLPSRVRLDYKINHWVLLLVCCLLQLQPQQTVTNALIWLLKLAKLDYFLSIHFSVTKTDWQRKWGDKVKRASWTRRTP